MQIITLVMAVTVICLTLFYDINDIHLYCTRSTNKRYRKSVLAIFESLVLTNFNRLMSSYKKTANILHTLFYKPAALLLIMSDQ